MPQKPFKYPCEDEQGGLVIFLWFLFFLLFVVAARVSNTGLVPLTRAHDGCSLPRLPITLSCCQACNIGVNRHVYPQVEKKPSQSLCHHSIPNRPARKPPGCVASARLLKYKTSVQATPFFLSPGTRPRLDKTSITTLSHYHFAPSLPTPVCKLPPF